jgi:hypothetical protein
MPPEEDALPLTPAQEQRLALHLDALRNETAALDMPAQYEDVLLAAFRKHHTGQRTHSGRPGFFAQWLAPGVALAASIGMAAWMVFAPLARVDVPPGETYTVTGGGDAPFIALLSLEQIAAEPSPRVVTAAVPRVWLASYGVPVNPQIAGDAVRAEMLVSANGQPLAMRFVP